MNKKVLVLVFKTQDGEKFRLTLENPKDGLDDVKIKEVMNRIISEKVFMYKAALVTAIADAKIVSTTTQDFIE